MNKSGLIDLLNEDLELEYRSIVQYVQHIASVKGAQWQSTLDELGVHLGQELDHALILARQIDFLGGVPSTRVPDAERGEDARAALEQDLALEEGQLRRYRERVEQANELGLPDLAETIAPLLSQTQEHAPRFARSPRIATSVLRAKDPVPGTRRDLHEATRRIGPGRSRSSSPHTPRPDYQTRRGVDVARSDLTQHSLAKGARLAHLLGHTDVEAGSGGGDCSSRRRIVSSPAVATGP